MLTPIKITELDAGSAADLVGTNILAATTDYSALATEDTLKFTFDQVVQEGIKSITTLSHLQYLNVAQSITVSGREVLRGILVESQKTEGSEASVTARNFEGITRLSFVFPEGQPGEQGDTGPSGDIGITGPASTVEGPTGQSGDTGPKGDTGPTGADSTVEGPTGETGASGVGSTITISAVATGNPDDDAQVNNVGTDTNVQLQFVIPKGKQGDPGTNALTPTFSYDLGSKTLTITNA